MSVSVPDTLWPLSIPAVVLLALARWKCVELAEGYSRFVFNLISLGLPPAAKKAWRQEALWVIIELISRDLVVGRSREVAAWNAVRNATNLLICGWSDRAHYVEDARRAGCGDQSEEGLYQQSEARSPETALAGFQVIRLLSASLAIGLVLIVTGVVLVPVSAITIWRMDGLQLPLIAHVAMCAVSALNVVLWLGMLGVTFAQLRAALRLSVRRD